MLKNICVVPCEADILQSSIGESLGMQHCTAADWSLSSGGCVQATAVLNPTSQPQRCSRVQRLQQHVKESRSSVAASPGPAVNPFKQQRCRHGHHSCCHVCSGRPVYTAGYTAPSATRSLESTHTGVPGVRAVLYNMHWPLSLHM